MPVVASSHWKADVSQPIWQMTAGDALRRAAQLAEGRTALVEAVPNGMPSLAGAAATDRRWTYAELLADAETCARWLLTRFRPGDHICLWAPNVPEWVIVQYGAALAGMVLVTANPSLRDEELAHVLTRSRARGLIHATNFRGSDMAATAQRVADTSLIHVLLADVAEAIATDFGDEPLPTVPPLSPAQMQFTSGTTGRPKGALLRHQALVTNAAFVAARIGQAEDVVVTPMPLFHTAGSVLGVLGAVTTLSTLVLPVVFDPALMLRSIAAERATVTSGVPTMLSAMIEELAGADYNLSTLKVVYSGGAPVAPELLSRVERHFGCPLVSVYGQTELSPIVCATDIEDDVADRAATAGRPLPQVELRIVDAGSAATVLIGAEGEVQARGYQTMVEYFDQPDATAATILPDGWLRTGDLGTIDNRGFVRITGRLSDMIIRGGENIYPAEIEAALLRHHDIAEAAVFGVRDPHWGEMVAAAIRLQSGGPLPLADTLKQHCRELLSPQKTPTEWFIVENFPLTASGKIQKFALADMARSEQLKRL